MCVIVSVSWQISVLCLETPSVAITLSWLSVADLSSRLHSLHRWGVAKW